MSLVNRQTQQKPVLNTQTNSMQQAALNTVTEDVINLMSSNSISMSQLQWDTNGNLKDLGSL